MIRKEAGKIMRNPMPWVMTFLFISLNLLLSYGYIGEARFREQFGRTHDIILDYGVDLNESEGTFSQTDELSEFYREYVEEAAALYDNLDMLSILEERQKLSSFHPAGAYKDFIAGNYAELQRRVDEIKDTGEGRYGFYPGSVYRFHTLLFGTIGRWLMAEMAVLMTLCVLYVMDYERVHKTCDIVTATRMGKGVMYCKIPAGMGCGILFSSLLAAGTYGYFFYCVPFKGLWGVPVASAVLAEPRPYGYYPFVTFWKLTVRGYFVLTLTVFLAALVVAGGLAASLWLILRNSYLAFMADIILYMVWFLLCFWNTDTFPDVVKNMNLVALWILSGGWFMEHELMFSFPGSEFWCVGVSAVFVLLLFLAGRRRYLRLEV